LTAKNKPRFTSEAFTFGMRVRHDGMVAKRRRLAIFSPRRSRRYRCLAATAGLRPEGIAYRVGVISIEEERHGGE
jgi:hypothetical protein